MTAKRHRPRWSSRKRRLVVGTAIFGVAVVAVALVALVPAKVPDLNDRRRIEAGAALYARHCASCHGANLEGQPEWRTPLPNGRLPAPPHDDTGHTWHHRLELLFEITRSGMKTPLVPRDYESDMPGFAGVMTDDEIWDVLAFIRSRWSDRVRIKNDRIAARAIPAAGH